MDEPEQKRERRRRGRLAEEAFAAGKPDLSRDDLGVGDRLDRSARLVAGAGRTFPRSRITDPDRRRHGPGVRDGLAGDDGGRPVGLGSHHPWQASGATGCVILPEALPVGGDVASVADRQQQVIRSLAQRIDHFVRSRLLTLDPMRVDRIHERHRIAVAQLTHGLERLVEATFDRNDLGAVHEGLRQLVEGDLSRWDHNDGSHPGPGCVGGHGG